MQKTIHFQKFKKRREIYIQKNDLSINNELKQNETREKYCKFKKSL